MADLHTETEAIESKDFTLIGVASGADTESQIATFQEHYDITDVEIWIDSQKHYLDIIQPGQPSYPIEIVLDREGIIRYLAAAYHPGQAVAVVKELLGQ